MRILVLAGAYPYPERPSSGIFNEKCVVVLQKICEYLEVLAPRPYVPYPIKLFPRWKDYSQIPGYQIRNGVSIHRPSTLVIPRIGSALWCDRVAYLWCRNLAIKLHHKNEFDAILSFDLSETGGIAWRLGKALKIPAVGWAFGNDVRFSSQTSLGQVVVRALRNLDLIFYQSQELLQVAASHLDTSSSELPSDQHVVLAHGIPDPPFLMKEKISKQIRATLGIGEKQVVVTYVGRMVKEKGILDLVEVISSAVSQDDRIVCLMIGSYPSFDETALLKQAIRQSPSFVQDRIRVLPACEASGIWEYLCATDIFAFPSHREGMPNSLLEAIAIGVPVVAFAIPPVLEINQNEKLIYSVPPFDCELFAKAIVSLARSPEDRGRMGQLGTKEVKRRFSVEKNMREALKYIKGISKNL